MESNHLRAMLLAVFLFGAVGVGLELVLLEHTEDWWQWVPIVLLGCSVPLTVVLAFTQRRILVQAFQSLMVLFVGAGGIGVVLHFRGNVEFELEMYPSMRGLALVWESLKGATPGLAPGTMALLGLIGLIYAYGHAGTTRSPVIQRKDFQS